MTLTAIRFLGCGLLALAGALLGYGKHTELRRQKQCLEQLCVALGRMESELTALRTPMPQILARLENCRFFLLVSAGFGAEPLERLWSRAAQAQPIPVQDRNTLGELSNVIGRYDAQRQAGEIALVRQRLTESAKRIQQEMQQRSSRYAGLGAALGAMLAVLLL